MSKQREEFESHFKTTEIYKREVNIRTKDILEFSNTMNGYFNVISNEAWTMWQQAQKVAVPDGFVLMPKELNTQIVEAFWNSWLVERPNPQTIYFAYQAMIEAQEQNDE